MPIYEYECTKCNDNSITEIICPTKDSIPEKVICLECGSTMQKLISKSSFHLRWEQRARDAKAGRVRDE